MKAWFKSHTIHVCIFTVPTLTTKVYHSFRQIYHTWMVWGIQKNLSHIYGGPFTPPWSLRRYLLEDFGRLRVLLRESSSLKWFDKFNLTRQQIQPDRQQIQPDWVFSCCSVGFVLEGHQNAQEEGLDKKIGRPESDIDMSSSRKNITVICVVFF